MSLNQSKGQSNGRKLREAIKSNSPDEGVQAQTLSLINEYLKSKGQTFPYEYSMYTLHLLLSDGSRYNNAGEFSIFIQLLIEFFFLPENSSRFPWSADTVLSTLSNLKKFFDEMDDEARSAEYDHFLFSHRFHRVKESEVKSGLPIEAEIPFYKKKIKALQYERLLERAYPIP